MSLQGLALLLPSYLELVHVDVLANIRPLRLDWGCASTVADHLVCKLVAVSRFGSSCLGVGIRPRCLEIEGTVPLPSGTGKHHRALRAIWTPSPAEATGQNTSTPAVKCFQSFGAMPQSDAATLEG